MKSILNVLLNMCIDFKIPGTISHSRLTSRISESTIDIFEISLKARIVVVDQVKN
jgi:hypothetical protein